MAEEILTEYLEFWVAAEKVKKQEKDRQQALLLSEPAQKRGAREISLRKYPQQDAIVTGTSLRFVVRTA